MPRLIIKEKNSKTRVFALNKDMVTLGRNPDNTIPLNSLLISRYHAFIEKRGDNSYFFVDLKSRNGSYVNGLITRECALKDKDIIRLGDFLLRFEATQNAPVVFSEDAPLEILHQVGKAISTIGDEKDLLKTVMDLIFKLTKAKSGVILLVDDQTGEFSTKVFKSNADDKIIFISKTIVDKVLEEKVGLLLSDVVSDPRFSEQDSIIASGIHSVMSVPIIYKDKTVGIVQVDSSEANYFSSEDLIMLCTISDYLAIAIEQSKLIEKIKKEAGLRATLERYHSPEIVNLIVNNYEQKGDIGLLVEEKEATILFVDICDFSSIAERVNGKEIAMLLNNFFSKITDIIFEYQGTLDKYTGDGVMAVFGVPYANENHAERAVWAALSLMEAIANIFSEEIKIRVGINTGMVVAGNIGSPKRMEYSVFGDAVNVSSSLCSLANAKQILIGGRTRELLPANIKLNEIGEKVLEGKKKSVLVYEVLEP